MIVCSCNILSDQDVRGAVRASEDLPRNAKQLYGCLAAAPNAADVHAPSRLSSIRLSTCARQRAFDDSADDKTRLTCQFQAHARPCRPFDTQVSQSLSPRFFSYGEMKHVRTTHLAEHSASRPTDLQIPKAKVDRASQR